MLLGSSIERYKRQKGWQTLTLFRLDMKTAPRRLSCFQSAGYHPVWFSPSDYLQLQLRLLNFSKVTVFGILSNFTSAVCAHPEIKRHNKKASTTFKWTHRPARDGSRYSREDTSLDSHASQGLLTWVVTCGSKLDDNKSEKRSRLVWCLNLLSTWLLSDLANCESYKTNIGKLVLMLFYSFSLFSAVFRRMNN